MKLQMIHILLVMMLYIVSAGPLVAVPTTTSTGSLLHVYEVNQTVSDFPAEEDFSTPEKAYAVVNRVMASGQEGMWRRISVKRLASGLPAANAKKRTVTAEDAKVWLNTVILEVRIFRGVHAGVIAKTTYTTGKVGYDCRMMDLENDRWLNAGQGVSDSMEGARTYFAKSCVQHMKRPSRPRIDNPKAYLRPFVDFLNNAGEDPNRFAGSALANHKIVIIGEIHHRPRYWAFNSSLVIDPAFVRRVGTIYMELPQNDQSLVNRFLNSQTPDTTPIIEMLRDNLWMGWPDQAMLEFFLTVWMRNQNLPREQKLRIVLVDMQRPWKRIKKREDWQDYEVNRDRYMAENILRDIREHPKNKRNVLFIVGAAHARLRQQYFDKTTPVRSAGWYLQAALGPNNVYAILQHMPVQTNQGKVGGRLCLGVFDSAFDAIGNKPIAFPLATGPFGEQPFDAFPDHPVNSTYRDGYSGYLYLGPLEYEIFSPLIAGFYTDEFVKELDRRCRIMFDRGLIEGGLLTKLDSNSFIEWMSNGWGKPRLDWKKSLGPVNAWQYGDKWEDEIRTEMHRRASEHATIIVVAAKRLFERIRDVDYDYYLAPEHKEAWRTFPISYQVYTDYPGFVQWVCRAFKRNPIKSISLGTVSSDENSQFIVPYKLTLTDGIILEGKLPFDYSPHGQEWYGTQGIDWHLKYKSGLKNR